MRTLINYLFRDLINALHSLRKEQELTNRYLHDIRHILDYNCRLTHGGYHTPSFSA